MKEYKMTETQETKLEAQDGKLRIHYEDESVKVLHNVETFKIELNRNGIVEQVDFLKREKHDIQFDIIKGERYITNFKGSLETDGNYERATIMKEHWRSSHEYSYSDNPIIAVYFAGELVHMHREEEKEDN